MADSVGSTARGALHGASPVEGISQGNLPIQGLLKSRQGAGIRQPEKDSWKARAATERQGRGQENPQRRGEQNGCGHTAGHLPAEALGAEDNGGMGHGTHMLLVGMETNPVSPEAV